MCPRSALVSSSLSLALCRAALWEMRTPRRLVWNPVIYNNAIFQDSSKAWVRKAA